MSVENLKTQSEVFFRSWYSINARLIYFLFYPLDSHTHVSLLINMGFTPVAIGNRVGHESSDITFRYAHMFPSEQKQMATMLNNAFTIEEKEAD